MRLADTNPSKVRAPKPEDLRLELDEWIAECQSLSPDRTLGIRNIGSSWDALCLIYILTHIAPLFWITDGITRRITQKAYQAKYQGEWQTVQEILEQNPQTPEEFYQAFLMFHSPEDFFGNLRKRARRLVLLIRMKKRDPHGPVSYPKRARGYRDKGTYHPPHEYHGEPPEKEPMVDRRLRVGHPLLREEPKDHGGMCYDNSGGE